MSDDSDTSIDYISLTRKAHMTIVREALQCAEKNAALPGQHHFYISFLTQHPDIRLSNTLLERFPQEMNIVIQHQFWDLRVNEHSFEIVLKFGGVPEQLYVPFQAITRFADPSVEFSLIFIPLDNTTPPQTENTDSIHDHSGEIVSLAAFRNRD